METKYIVKRFSANSPIVFEETVNCSKPVRRITVETMVNGKTEEKVYNAVYDGAAVNQYEAYMRDVPLPPVIATLQSDLSPEPNCGMLMIGMDCEAFSKYEYIYQSPREFGGTCRFRLLAPFIHPDTRFTTVLAPDDDFYVAIKVELYYS